MVPQDPIDYPQLHGVAMLDARTRQRKLFLEKLAHSGLPPGDGNLHLAMLIYIHQRQGATPGAQLFLCPSITYGFRDGHYLTGPSDFGFKHPVATRWTSNPKVFAAKGDILMTVKGSGLGSINILNTERAAISRQLMAIRVRNADPEFIYVLLLAQYDHIQSLGGGAAIPGITREHVLGVKIPLPPLATQQQIVAEIAAEQALVAANRELVTRFEKKIQATLARVWGES